MTLEQFQKELLKALAEATSADDLRHKLFAPVIGLAHKSATVDGKDQKKVPALLDLALKRLADFEKQRELDNDEFKNRAITDWKRARGVIEHENALTNYRLTWMIQTQTIFFAAYGILLKEYLSSSDGTLQKSYLALIVIVALAGMLFCGAIWRLLVGAERHHEHIRSWWNQLYEGGLMPEYPEMTTKRQHPAVAGHWVSWGDRRAWASNLPWIFIGAWFVLSVISGYRLLIGKEEDFNYVLIVIGICVATGIGIAALIYAGMLIERMRKSTKIAPKSTPTGT